MSERSIFLSALDIPHGADRQAYLHQVCEGEPQLRMEVEALLKSHDDAGEFLVTPVVDQVASPPATLMIGDSTKDACRWGDVPELPATLDLTLSDTDRLDADVLSFLQPSEQPGSLGRLAHYSVREVLGCGAFGIVLRAFDEKLHRLVAIKVMKPELAALSRPRKRFLREAQSSAAIRHENIVSIYAVEDQPIPYLVMEYIPGQTLQRRLDEQGPLDVGNILRIGQQIAAGLAAAHAEGLIHRDIKPANILLETGLKEGVKITDFGLARAVDDASLSHSGFIAGTPTYMAPEQANAGAIDQRADLFSLGSVLYVMGSGRLPFQAESTLAVLKRVAEDVPQPICEIVPGFPEWLSAIISKLHAKRPEDRFQTARDVADELGRRLAEWRPSDRGPSPSEISAPAPQATSSQARSLWRSWTASALTACLVLAGIIITITNPDGTKTTIEVPEGSKVHVSEVHDPAPAVSATADPAPPLSVKWPVAAEWIPLFNGRDLTGWQSPRQVDEWKVDSGVLIGTCRDTDSFLFSERGDWNDFHLRLEATISRDGDGGLYFRAHPSQAGKPGEADGEIQLTGLANYSFPTGSLFQGHPVQPATADLVKPDQWFTMELIARGPQLTVRINDQVVLEHTSASAPVKPGHLALQMWSPGTVVQFRKIEVQRLAPSTGTAPLSTDEAQRHQVAYSEQLGVPIESVNSLGMQFRLVPPGEFLMGAPAADSKAQSLERPQHAVRITRPFYAGSHEVTVAQFREFVDATNYQTSAEQDSLGSWHRIDIPEKGRNPAWTWRTPGFVQSDKHPVCCVSSRDAEQFCEWLSRTEGTPHRLPTEAEWEYACRAGTTAPFHFGVQLDLTQARVNNPAGTVPVGSHAPNAWGLFDMHGNVYEWCRDGRRSYQGDPAVDPLGPTELETSRVVRGGGWTSSLGLGASRSSARPVTCAPDRPFHGLGFRVIRNIESDTQPPAASR